MTQNKRTSDVCPMTHWVKPCKRYLNSFRNKEFLVICVKFQADFHCFSLTWSLIRDNVIFIFSPYS